MEGECHFLEGNIRARKWVQYTKNRLEEIGIESERLDMFNMGASDAFDFVEAVRTMDARVRELGPSPLNPAFSEYKKGIENQGSSENVVMEGNR